MLATMLFMLAISVADSFIRASGTLARPSATDKTTTGRRPCSQLSVGARLAGVNRRTGGALFVGGQDHPHGETGVWEAILGGVNDALKKLETDASTYSMMKVRRA